MKYIAYMLGSTTSAQKKHYTVILTETGYLITHYGTRSVVDYSVGQTNRQMDYRPTDGRILVEAITPEKMDILPTMMNTVFGRKRSSGEYNTAVMALRGNLTFADTPFIDKEVAKRIAFDFHDKVRSKILPNEETVPNSLPVNTVRRFIDRIPKDDTTVDTNGNEVTIEETPNTVEPVEFYYTDTNGKVIRPNGEEYRPREIMGHTDVALLRGFREKGIFIRLAGPPGAGKTALAEGAFGDELITITGHGDMTVANFVGTWLPRRDRKVGESEWEWQDGPLVRAMKEGKVFFVDEGTRIPTEVLNILFSVMDGRNMLRLDDRPDLDVIHGKEGFYVIMGYNPDTLGARVLDEALVSRFRVQINVKTDMNTAKALNIPATAIKIAKNLISRDKADRNNGGPGVWVPQMRELLTFKELVDARAGEDFALSNLVASCPREMDVPALLESIKESTNKSVSLPELGSLV